MSTFRELAVEDRLDCRRVAPLKDLEPGSDPWLKARKLGLGGSDAAAVLGLGEWASAFEVFLDKTDQHPDGLTTAENEAMKWGKLLEDPVADECERRTGMTFVRPTYLYQHRDIDWILANPDRVAIDPERSDLGVYEGKTCGPWMADRWGEHETDPATYALLQAVHYMVALNLRWAIIAVLISGQDYRHYRVELDDDLAKMLVEYEGDLWDRVQRNDPPTPTWRDADKDLLQRLWGGEGEPILVGPEAVDLARRYNAAKAAAKVAEKEKEQAGNELRLLLGDAVEGKDVDGRTVATWKPSNSRKLNQERFKSTSPHLFATYCDTKPVRTLLVKDV